VTACTFHSIGFGPQLLFFVLFGAQAQMMPTFLRITGRISTSAPRLHADEDCAQQGGDGMEYISDQMGTCCQPSVPADHNRAQPNNKWMNRNSYTTFYRYVVLCAESVSIGYPTLTHTGP